MSMLRNQSKTELDDGPHTLRSDIHSPEISILRPSHCSSTLISNSLEISQSPTRALISESRKSQCSFNSQTPFTTAIISKKGSCGKHNPMEILTNLRTTNQDEMQQCSGHLYSTTEKNVEAFSEEKNTDEKIIGNSSQTLPGSPTSNLPNLMNELSPGVTICKINPLSDPASQSSCNLLHGPSIFSTSDSPPSPSVFSPISSQQFFSFVIFHAPEDQEIANRVCKVLEHLGVGKGTTFAEGFEIPGASPLTCLENAVENSAYIILLLTNAFLKATWGDFQSTTAMMNSIENASKRGTVIPFYSYQNKPKSKIPLWIKSLVPLDENTSVFKNKVHNTFKQDVIRHHHEGWKRLKRTTDFPNFQQQNVSLHWSMDDTTVLPQQTQPPLPVCHGHAPVIQISHARNVQIGNQNGMTVQFSPNEPQMDWDTNLYQGMENESPNENMSSV